MAYSEEEAKKLPAEIAALNERVLDLLGLPLDVMLVMVFRAASMDGLVANGHMAQVGDHGQFIPTKETLTLWLNSYINRVVKAEAAQKAKDMATQQQPPQAPPAQPQPGLDMPQ